MAEMRFSTRRACCESSPRTDGSVCAHFRAATTSASSRCTSRSARRPAWCGARSLRPADRSQRPLWFDYAFTLRDRTVLLYEGANGLRSDPIGLPASRRSLRSRLAYVFGVAVIGFAYVYVLAWAWWHRWRGHLADEGHAIHRTSLRQWCRSRLVSARLFDTVLVPLFACVNTCAIDDVAAMPAAEILGPSRQGVASTDRTDYVIRTFGQKHYVADVRQVVSLLALHVPPANIHLGCELTRVSLVGPSSGSTTPTSDTASGPTSRPPSQLELETADGQSFVFDDVVFASQANHARTLLRSFAKSLDAAGHPTSVVEAELERVAALDAFQYTRTLVINHTDGSVLPPDAADRRDLNIALADPSAAAPSSSTKHLDPRTHVQATHIVARTRPNLPDGLLQTTNPTRPIDPSTIISQTWFERAVVSAESKRTLRRFRLGVRAGEGDLQGRHGIWLAGSWAAEGIPLLESAVVSAERVVYHGLMAARR